jgi:hypothetical protein
MTMSRLIDGLLLPNKKREKKKKLIRLFASKFERRDWKTIIILLLLLRFIYKAITGWWRRLSSLSPNRRRHNNDGISERSKTSAKFNLSSCLKEEKLSPHTHTQTDCRNNMHFPPSLLFVVSLDPHIRRWKKKSCTKREREREILPVCMYTYNLPRH